MEFIDAHVGERTEGLGWGVETICAQLTELGAKIAPATYYEHRGRTPSARAQRDEQLRTEIARVHAANYGLYGARKVWLTLNRERPGRSTADRPLHRRAPDGRAGADRRPPRQGQAHHHPRPGRRSGR